MSRRPYLSIVATARNDDHGGNLLRRMQIFVNGLIAQTRRHDVPIELVLVEWNPPSDKPSLADALDWPDSTEPLEVRIVTVGADVHQRYRFAEVLPLYQMIAKNVGIRRAVGEFILATNIDILFSDEIFEFFAKQRLEHGRMYRVDRHDAASDVPLEASIEEQLDYCRSQLLRINAREGSYRVSSDGQRIHEHDDIVSPADGVILGHGWGEFSVEPGGTAYRWAQPSASLLLTVPEFESDLWLLVVPGPGASGRPVKLQAWLDDRFIGRAEVVGLSRIRVPGTVNAARPVTLILQATPAIAPEDPRVPLYRVLDCRWKARSAVPPRPSASPPSPSRFPTMRLGAGWHEFESDGHRSFQWGANRAEWIIGPSAENAWSLLAEFEPGPAVGFGAIHLQVRDECHRLLSSAVVDDRRVVRLAVSASPDRETSLRLFAVYGKPAEDLPGEHRELSFKLYGCRWAGGKTTALSGAAGPDLSFSAPPEADIELTLPDSPDEPSADTVFTPAPHTNGCGDFTLLDRESWHDLRGYPEFDLFSMHLDSVLCIAAHYGGASEVVLEPPMQVFHIEHAVGSGFTPEGNKKLYQRLAAKGIESLDWREVFAWEQQMRRLDSPMVFNRSNWGLVDETLSELRVSGR